MNLYEDLKWRGLVDNITSDDLIEKLNKGGLSFYIGIDPTADSMHIGHFSSLLAAKRLKDSGHNPILLVGGATGMIGDPKPNAERPMIDQKTLNNNIKGLEVQLKNIFGFEMVNNANWLNNLNLIEYLRDYGKLFNINYMISKDTVKKRLATGITYTEFSYMILQSIDFLKLYEENKCTLQLGGQDQWGNITSGLELIRKKHGDVPVYGMTMPLITKADGSKFGKSETGAVWLDDEKTSPYELYQFFINSEDEKVVEYLKKFTFLSKAEIDNLEKQVKSEPHLRNAQKTLAKEVVSFIHGEKGYNLALSITSALFMGDISNLCEKELEYALKEFPRFNVKINQNIVDILLDNNIVKSKREARELITSGAIYINDKKQEDLDYLLKEQDSLFKKYFVFRRGKKKYYLGEISK